MTEKTNIENMEAKNSLIYKATQFAAKVHQHQTRKGKPIPYILHPLSVANRLSRVGASEVVIAAAILHDTIEDCTPYGSVSKELLEKEFGVNIARMVNDVTEQDKSFSWTQRKQAALDHIPKMDQDSLLVKSADVLDNLSDQILDYMNLGDKMFETYNATKDQQLDRYQKVIFALEKAWSENPILDSLKVAVAEAKNLWS